MTSMVYSTLRASHLFFQTRVAIACAEDQHAVGCPDQRQLGHPVAIKSERLTGKAQVLRAFESILGDYAAFFFFFKPPAQEEEID